MLVIDHFISKRTRMHTHTQSLALPIVLSASFAASRVNHVAVATRVHERWSPEVG